MADGGWIDLDRLIATARELPPLPTTTVRLVQMLASDGWDLDDAVALIELDPPLTLRILRLANSVECRGAERIASVSAALRRLGSGTVTGIAMAVAARDHALTRRCDRQRAESIWRHSIAAALAVESGARVGRAPSAPEAFTAAVLHDIGSILLYELLDAGALPFLDRARREGGCAAEEAEAELLDVDHAEVGGLIASVWQLPEVMVEAIRTHHAPWHAASAHARCCRAVAVAECVADRIAPVAGEERATKSESRVLETVGLGAEDFERTCADVAMRLDETLACYE